jgi:hypothetical protein
MFMAQSRLAKPRISDDQGLMEGFLPRLSGSARQLPTPPGSLKGKIRQTPDMGAAGARECGIRCCNGDRKMKQKKLYDRLVHARSKWGKLGGRLAELPVAGVAVARINSYKWNFNTDFNTHPFLRFLAYHGHLLPLVR